MTISYKSYIRNNYSIKGNSGVVNQDSGSRLSPDQKKKAHYFAKQCAFCFIAVPQPEYI